MKADPSNPTNNEQLFTPLLRKIELVLVVLCAGSIVLKLLHASFANIVLIISLSSLSFLYLVSGIYLGGGRLFFFQSENSNIPFARKIATYMSGFAIGLICIGILFKLQFWYGAGSQMIVGLVSGAVAMVMTSLLFRKTRVTIYRQFLTRVAVFFSIGLILFLTPDIRLLEIIHPDNDPEKVAFKKYLEYPNDPEAQREWDQMQHKMDSIRDLK